jgi:hypothetical protein
MSEIQWRNEAAIDKPLMTLSREGLWVDPEIPADETARLVLAAIDKSIRFMVASAIAEEREACAKVADDCRYEHHISLTSMPPQNGTAVGIANRIRARGEA